MQLSAPAAARVAATEDSTNMQCCLRSSGIATSQDGGLQDTFPPGEPPPYLQGNSKWQLIFSHPISLLLGNCKSDNHLGL